jgi:hypothetical protein
MSLLTEEDEELLHEADNIAVKIAEVLIQAFKDKEGREPNGEELEALFDEVTEERVAEMISGQSKHANDEEVDKFSKDGDDDEVDEDKEVITIVNENLVIGSKLEKPDNFIAEKDSADSIVGTKRSLNEI